MIPTELMDQAAARLTEAGVPNPRKDLQRLWMASFDRRFHAYDDIVAGPPLDRFNAMVARRVNREPMSHILGERAFYNGRFVVSGAVLDPRPETEFLVAAALDVPFETVLDLGTGSGCILLSILDEEKHARGVGVDISQEALSVATDNLDRFNLHARCVLICSDWYQNVSGQFDLIVSNPPYIAANEMADLQPEVRDHEPRMALTDEADGLSHYRTIIAGAPDYLTPGGSLMVEIGPTQAAAVAAMMRERGFDGIQVLPDLDGRDRVVSARFGAN